MKPPPLDVMVAAFGREMKHWALRGFKVVDAETYKRRAEICADCPHWKPDAAMGSGRCLKCGCSGVKLYLETSACPISKWGDSSTPDPS